MRRFAISRGGEMGSKSRSFKAAMLGIALAMTMTCAVAQVTWRNHQLMPAAFWLVQNENKLAEEIGADSKGRFRIVVLPAASSGFKMGEVLDAVSENLLPMGYGAGCGPARPAAVRAGLLRVRKEALGRAAADVQQAAAGQVRRDGVRRDP